jgi:uncharacterized membrane protein YedE/YeeE
LRIMAGRLTVFTVFAFIGFLGGIVAYFAYKRLVPIILEMFPELLNAEWFLSGLGGALMTLILIVVWASFSPEKK